MHTHIHTHICTHTCTHTYTHTYIYAYTHTYKHIHTHAHIYIHTYIHTYTYIHTHTHIQTSKDKNLTPKYVNTTTLSTIPSFLPPRPQAYTGSPPGYGPMRLRMPVKRMVPRLNPYVYRVSANKTNRKKEKFNEQPT